MKSAKLAAIESATGDGTEVGNSVIFIDSQDALQYLPSPCLQSVTYSSETLPGIRMKFTNRAKDFYASSGVLAIPKFQVTREHTN